MLRSGIVIEKQASGKGLGEKLTSVGLSDMVDREDFKELRAASPELRLFRLCIFLTIPLLSSMRNIPRCIAGGGGNLGSSKYLKLIIYNENEKSCLSGKR